MSISPGDAIFVPISVENGAFPKESLITIETINGPVSGFIRSDEIEMKHGNPFVKAVVLEVSDEAITVRLKGSFFTTTGLAYISPATEFLRAA